MTVLDARRVAAEETGSVLDVALAELLRFAEFPQAFADEHGL